MSLFSPFGYFNENLMKRDCYNFLSGFYWSATGRPPTPVYGISQTNFNVREVKYKNYNLYIGGRFEYYASSGASQVGYSQKYLTVLNLDGSINTSFINSGFTPNNQVSLSSIEFTSDDKILMGGGLTNYGTVDYNLLGRLNSNGTLDSSWNSGNTGFTIGTFSEYVGDIEIDSSNNIWVGGFFQTYNGTTSNNLIKLNSDGSINTLFGSNFNSSNLYGVYDIQLLSDNSVLVGGRFDSYNGNNAASLIKLNSDNSLNTTFTNNFYNIDFGSCEILGIGVQSDGKIILSGGFNIRTYPDGMGFIRINSDGTFDNTFAIITNPINIGSNNLLVLPDDKFYINLYYGEQTSYFNRYNSDGTVDTSFKTNELGMSSNFRVSNESTCVLPNNDVILGATFQFLNNNGVYSIAGFDSFGNVKNCSFVFPPPISPTPTPTPTATPGLSPTPTRTPWHSPTPTISTTPTVTPTNTTTPTVTPTVTPTNTNTPTVTPTNTNTPTVTPTNTNTPTATRPTPTPSPTTLVCAYNFNYTVTTAGTFQWTQCNGTPFSQYLYVATWTFTLGYDGCVNLSSISSNDGGIGSITSRGTDCYVAPTPTGTPTPTPTNALFSNVVNYASNQSDACSNPTGTVGVGGNGTTFCNSTTFTSSAFFTFTTGNYVLAFGGNTINVSVTNGNQVATVYGGGCQVCPVTPTPTPTVTPTRTQTPTPTPTPTSPPTYLYYSVDRRATCNTGIENPVAMFAQLPYAFTPTLNGWYRDSSGVCTYSYRISNITPTNPGIFTPVAVDAVTYADSTLACGSGCIPTPTPTPTNAFSLSMVFSFQVDSGYGGSCQLYKSFDGITYSVVNSFSTTDSVTFTADAGYWYYITTNKTSGSTNSGRYAQSVWSIDGIADINVAPSQNNGTSVDSTPFQVATSGVHTYELRGYVTNLL